MTYQNFIMPLLSSLAGLQLTDTFNAVVYILSSLV